MRHRVGSRHVGHQRQVATIIRPRNSNASTRFQNVSNIILPHLRILCIRMRFRHLRTCLQGRHLIRIMYRQRIASTRRQTILCMVLKIRVISNVLNIRRQLNITNPFAIPTIRTLLRGIRLTPIMIIPNAMGLVTTLSRRIGNGLPILMTRTRHRTMNSVKYEVAGRHAIYHNSFAIAIRITRFRITQNSNYRYILKEILGLLLNLMSTFRLMTMRMTSKMSYRYMTLLLISNCSKMTFLRRTRCLILSNNGIRSSIMIPITCPITPTRNGLCTQVLSKTGISSAQCNTQSTQRFNRRIFNFLLMMRPFGIRTITRRINFYANFPNFRLLPTRFKIKRMNGLMTQVSNEQNTRRNKMNVHRRQFNKVNTIRILITRYTP